MSSRSRAVLFLREVASWVNKLQQLKTENILGKCIRVQCTFLITGGSNASGLWQVLSICCDKASCKLNLLLVKVSTHEGWLAQY